MTRIHWVERQNKLETLKEKDEVKKHEVLEYMDFTMCEHVIQTRW